MTENPGTRAGFPVLLRASDIARILAISKSQTYRLLKSGEIPTLRIGPGCLRIRPADLEAYLAQLKQEAA